MDEKDKDLFPITGIGSLPFLSVDSALEHSLLFDLPYLPQLPKKNKHEDMIYQSLFGLPGLEMKNGEEIFIIKEVWTQYKDELNRHMDQAMVDGSFRDFLPTPDVMCAWKRFIYKLKKNSVQKAKIQIAGPITCQYSTKWDCGTSIWEHDEVSTQINTLCLVRALAMVNELKKRNVIPVFFLDEPALFAYDECDQNFKNKMGLLGQFINRLKAEGAQVGIHCCGNTRWDILINMKLNYISFDAERSLDQFLEIKDKVWQYIENDGHIVLGVLPTHIEGKVDNDKLFHDTLEKLKVFCDDPNNLSRMLHQISLSPACGLVDKSSYDTANYYSNLRALQKLFRGI